MIEEIKKIITENKKNLFRSDFFENDLKVSKFFHGRPETNKKIIFYVSVFDKPLCIFKMTRINMYNDIIDREVAGLSAFPNISPKLFFHGQLGGLNYMCEEVASGVPVGKSQEVDYLVKVLEWHKNLTRVRQVKIDEIIKLFSNVSFDNDKEFGIVLTELLKRKEESLWLSLGHGDMTYKNIMVRIDKQITIIDWENFGLRPIYGIDIIHYLSRMIYTGDFEHDVPSALSHFTKDVEKYENKLGLGFTQREVEDLFLLDWFFEVLQKNNIKKYNEVIPLMQKIWSL
ncbi:MAG: hypothetical protein QG579_91 [Patescibacteria group bacterium]|nr:hypothetical protein [Patescibacteria group bacterium]